MVCAWDYGQDPGIRFKPIVLSRPPSKSAMLPISATERLRSPYKRLTAATTTSEAGMIHKTVTEFLLQKAPIKNADILIRQ